MKKREIITVALTSEQKERLLQIANEKEWTISHTARKLLENALKGSETDSRREDHTI